MISTKILFCSSLSNYANSLASIGSVFFSSIYVFSETMVSDRRVLVVFILIRYEIC